MSKVQIVEGYHTLLKQQKDQFLLIVAQGLRGKMLPALGDDLESMRRVCSAWMEYGFIPLDEVYCAIDQETQQLLSILLMNNFYNPSVKETISCVLSAARGVGLQKTLKLLRPFLQIDQYNKELSNPNVVAEIYLISTLEELRGKGVGTQLLSYVMERSPRYCKCQNKEKCTCQIKLLVFDKNPAKHLYQRQGFRVATIKETPIMAKVFGSEYDRLLLMDKTL